ncbi:unnamed protein product [Ectocarpus sp. CCAP 1310/34]|nr:unnamed protein product [Ectocarpus sp. CCAP 1310/34]
MVVATVNLGGRLAHNRAVRTKPKQKQYNRRELQFEAARCAVTSRFLLNLDTRLDERTTTAAELATDFTNTLLDAARTTLGEEPRRRRTQEWCETPETRAALEQALTKRQEAQLRKHNYRGISLLSHVGKVPIKIITNRLSAFCEANNILPEEQCGFRPGRSTVDMLFVVRRLQEVGRRKKIPPFMCFVDLNKAYY